jgi:hypothetical protein
MATNICRSSVCPLLHVTVLVPRILWWLLGFWKIYAALPNTVSYLSQKNEVLSHKWDAFEVDLTAQLFVTADMSQQTNQNFQYKFQYCYIATPTRAIRIA